jgi:hypothetical protein
MHKKRYGPPLLHPDPLQSRRGGTHKRLGTQVMQQTNTELAESLHQFVTIWKMIGSENAGLRGSDA